MAVRWLLDEISEMDARLQGQAPARDFKNGEIDRVGGGQAGQGRYPHHSRPSNRDLTEAVEEKHVPRRLALTGSTS